MPLRVLGAVRLSRTADESTSTVRQRERIEWWTGGNDGGLVHVAEDLDVSGAVSPFERPGLGEWLTPERAAEYDVLAAWKLDRLSRSAEDTHKLLRFAEDHDVRIVCVDDGIDTSSTMGRVFVQLAAIMAEVERTSIRDRVLASRAQLRREGRWAGGAPAYGLAAVPRTDGPGYTVVIDPDVYEHARHIVESMIAGRSLNSIAADLNGRGVPTPQDLRRIQAGREPRGRQWHISTVKSVVGSSSLRGVMSHDGRPVHGPDGLPVQSGEAVVTEAEWRQLQAILAGKQNRRTKTPSMLLDVAYCADCGAKLYRQGATKRGYEYLYYRCSAAVVSGNGGAEACRAKAIRATVLDEFVENEVLYDIGGYEVAEDVYVPGSDASDELERVERAIEDVRREKDLGLYEGDENAYFDRVQTLVKRRDELRQTSSQPARWERRGTGETYRELWARADVEQRRELLVNAGVTVKAVGDPLRLEYQVDLERLNAHVPEST